ncbi:MAG TPA: Lrp/AsnC family transcriptional regulator [Thiotrichales bacterium]|nr:Lrp/AsnC family transcriptional regulator [Thiotrichales bacterium]
MAPELTELERAVINRLQGGFPIAERPFANVAAELGTEEATLILTIQNLLDRGYLTRFGPMYHAERLGGALTLAALRVPDEDFDRVANEVNALPQVAHNYRRDHEFNMWFVLATETPAELADTLREIEARTGLPVYDFPKEEEFFIGLRFEV